ncbi:hypothetical protein H6F95_17430 [Cyanobacteria bacterium FACHB-471]|nr:hypothetical protein [Cyanobacteria bacterium FACHB-471]
MRDNHEGMPEILDAFQDGEQYFGVIAIELDDVSKKFRFGVSRRGYSTLKKILQLRPFDAMPGLKHRYFIAGVTGRIVDRKKPDFADFEIGVRVEQDKNGGTVSVESPKDLAQNLLWFYELKDFNKAEHLPEVE